MSQQEVYVPIVGNACVLMKLRVYAHGAPGPTHSVTVGDHNVSVLKKDQEIETIVRVARCRETNPAKRLELVSVQFCDCGDTHIDGKSYGLALAIADQLARHPESTVPFWSPPSGKRGRIIATGCVQPDDQGIQVTRVGEFPAKLRCLLARLGDGTLGTDDLFLYPKKNEDELAPADRRLLGDLGKVGLICRGIDLLDWEQPAPTPPLLQSEPESVEAEAQQPETPPPAEQDPQHSLALIGFLTILAVLAVTISGYLFLTRDRPMGPPVPALAPPVEQPTSANPTAPAEPDTTHQLLT